MNSNPTSLRPAGREISLVDEGNRSTKIQIINDTTINEVLSQMVPGEEDEYIIESFGVVRHKWNKILRHHQRRRAVFDVPPIQEITTIKRIWSRFRWANLKIKSNVMRRRLRERFWSICDSRDEKTRILPDESEEAGMTTVKPKKKNYHREET